MKFRNGKWYKPKETADWAVQEHGKLSTITLHKSDKLIYSLELDKLIGNSGFSICNANRHVDKFEPYISEEDVKMYKREEIRSAELAMQALLSNESVIPSADFNLKAVARTSCQMASALVREMIDEEFWDE